MIPARPSGLVSRKRGLPIKKKGKESSSESKMPIEDPKSTTKKKSSKKIK